MEQELFTLSKFTIVPESPLEEALQKIEDNGYGTLIVVRDGRAVGTITDGDIRKVLLTHRLSIIPVREIMNTDFLSVMPGDIDRARSLFTAKFYLRLLPEVDAEGRLCGVMQRDKLA